MLEFHLFNGAWAVISLTDMDSFDLCENITWAKFACSIGKAICGR